MEHGPRTQINTQIYEEACQWFLEFRMETPDSTQQSRFDTWMRRSPEHVAAYLEVAALWNDPAAHDQRRLWDRQALLRDAAAEPANVVSLDLPEMMHQRPSLAPAQTVPTRTQPKRLRAAPIAASALLATAVGSYVFLTHATTYTTDVGEQRIVALTDGSSMELDAQTRVAVRFSANERRVELIAGRALFQVAKSQSRPFVVSSGDTRVRAIGTEFDVYRKESSTVVTVVEGRVAVEAATGAAPAATESTATQHRNAISQDWADRPPVPQTYVAAGEQLTVLPDQSRETVRPDVANATAWINRKIVFEGAYLSEVSQEFNRYSRRRLVIEAGAPRDFRLSGVFSTTDIDSIIRFLRERPELDVIESPSQVHVRKKIG